MESIVYFEEYRQWEWFTWCLMPLGVGVATCGLLLLAGVLDPCFRSLHKSAAEMWIAPMRLDAEPGSAWARALQWMDFEVAEEEGAADGGGGGAFTAPLLFDQEQRSGSDQRCVAFPRGTGCANGRDGGAAALPPGARDCPPPSLRCAVRGAALTRSHAPPFPPRPAPQRHREHAHSSSSSGSGSGRRVPIARRRAARRRRRRGRLGRATERGRGRRTGGVARRGAPRRRRRQRCRAARTRRASECALRRRAPLQ